MEKGECPSLLVVFDSVEGFTVHADRYIKDLTIITKYVGDVDYLKNRKNDDGDSMMIMLHVSNPLKSLVICPDKRSNIARFVNGINNFSPDGRKKQNLKCVRYDVNGSVEFCRLLTGISEKEKDCTMITMDMNMNTPQNILFSFSGSP